MNRGSVTGVGYEGADIGGFIARLRLRGIDRVVDVRLTPLSRKRGFSKNGLREALAGAGIDYTHFRALGNPKSNREGFASVDGDAASASRSIYRQVLSTEDALVALDQIRTFATTEHVALLCFEADEAHCHRELVLAELGRISLVAA